MTEGNVYDLNIVWSRSPSPLSISDRIIEKHIVNNSTLHTSLTLWNIQPYPDKGNYTVVASNNCTSNESYFFLQVNTCKRHQLPQPVMEFNITVIPEPELPNILRLVAEFQGETNEFYAPTDWIFGDNKCLEGGGDEGPSQFSCDREILDQCSFVANLWIKNPTHANSGTYTVLALNDDKQSNVSIIDLRK